jgi:hypothetical protein
LFHPSWEAPHPAASGSDAGSSTIRIGKKGILDMGTDDLNERPLETKAIKGVIEELERQAAENPSKLKIRRDGDRVIVNGEIEVDALVMVVVGSMAGGP